MENDMKDGSVEDIAIIGTGTMGAMIAVSMAVAGIRVRLYSNDPASVEQGFQSIGRALDAMVSVGVMDVRRCRAARALIDFSTTLHEAVVGADIVVEAVPEQRDIKAAVFDNLSMVTGPQTVVWSNTSSLDVFALAPIALHPRLIVAHWFHPAHILPLVEVVPGPDTASDTVDMTVATLDKIGKVPVVMNGFIAGFVINRLLRALGREAFYLVDNGYISSKDLDLAVRASIAPRMLLLGVMQRYDFTDLRISASNLQNPDFIDAPEDKAPRSLMEHIKRGEYGVKSGRGFYDYGSMTEQEILKTYEDRLWDVMKKAVDLQGGRRAI